MSWRRIQPEVVISDPELLMRVRAPISRFNPPIVRKPLKRQPSVNYRNEKTIMAQGSTKLQKANKITTALSSRKSVRTCKGAIRPPNFVLTSCAQSRHHKARQEDDSSQEESIGGACKGEESMRRLLSRYPWLLKSSLNMVSRQYRRPCQLGLRSDWLRRRVTRR